MYTKKYNALVMITATLFTIASCHSGYKAINPKDLTPKDETTITKIITEMVTLTPENILQYANENTSTKPPQELVEHVKTYYKANPSELNDVDSKKLLEQFKKELDKPREQRGGLGFHSWKNSIRDFMYKNYVEKIAGTVNKIFLQIAAQNLPYGNYQKLDAKKIKEKTYQTASRMFHHLRIINAIKEHKMDRMFRPTSHLINVLGKNTADDQACAFYEERLPSGFLPLSEYRKYNRGIDDHLSVKAFHELLIVIKEAGLWDLSDSNIFLNYKNGTLCVVDTEQPNTMKPAHDFHKDWIEVTKGKYSRWTHNIIEGYLSLAKMINDKTLFKDKEKYLRPLRQFILRYDKVFRTASPSKYQYEDLKELVFEPEDIDFETK